ncbi:2-dehydro-3-deoxygalactonokinase [Rhizobiaceae sp. 2RAB30]
MSGATDWIAVDWGTSNLRVWGIDADGAVTFANSSEKGMGKLERAAFPAALSEVLAGHVEPGADPYDVLISGMAGARQGWMEAPYVEAPADLDALLASAVRPEMPDPHLSPRILPGVCQRGQGAEDVMRGEETQLLGLSALLEGFSGTVVMPGTHSKWAELDGRTVRRFATAMTGELFDERANYGHVGLHIGNGLVVHAWDVVRVDHYAAVEKLEAADGWTQPRYLGWVPVERILHGHRVL